MEMPARGVDIINQLYQQHRDLAETSDDSRRDLTLMMGEQFAFEFGVQWGVKSAGPGRPQGPSEIAFNGPPLLIWRWSDGDGHVTHIPWSPLPQPLLQPLDQSQGQIFLPCLPINHLLLQPVPLPDPGPGSGPTPVPVTAEPVDDEIERMIVKLENLHAGIEDLTLAMTQLTARIVELRQNGIKLRF